MDVNSNDAILFNNKVEGIRWLLLNEQLELFVESRSSDGQVTW